MNWKHRPGINPIIVKELRSRMRGARAFAILTAILLLLGGATYGIYAIMLATAPYTAMLSPQIGQTLFISLTLLELLMICFITPAVTAGAVSSEREKLTYEMLLTTPLRPASILWGKLISALSYVLLLIFAAVPLASLVFIFGGVAPWEMLKALIVLVAVAIMLGVVGITLSAWLGRTARATVLSYLAVLALILGPLAIYILAAVARQGEPPRWILIPNPLSALFSAMTPRQPTGAFSGLTMALSGNLDAFNGNNSGNLRPLYQYSLPLYAGLTLVLYLLATQLVKPARRWHISGKGIGAAVALFLVLGSIVALGFGITAGRYEQASALPTPAPVMPMPARAVAVQQAIPAPMVGPVPTATPDQVDIAQLDAQAQAEIYAAVVRQVYASTDGPAGEDAQIPTVYLVRTTDDVVGFPDAPMAPAAVLPDPVQEALVGDLADLPADLRWVDSLDDVPTTPDSDMIVDDGAALVLGNIRALPGNQVLLVSATLHRSALSRSGNGYVLVRTQGRWRVNEEARASWTH